MKFYVSTTALSNSGSAGKGSPTTATRRISSRTLLLVVLVLGMFLPFLFLRVAFLMLESATACSSPLGCIRWRFLSGADSSPKLREELSRALVEAKEGNIDEEGIQSFNELVKDFTSRRGDIKAFAFKTKATLLQMEREVQSARQHNSISWHLASRGIPRSLHCLSLNLAEEYTVNSRARSCLPPPEYLSRLSDPSCFHLVLLTDNVLAASTVVSSTLQNSANPGKLVFHIVTDKKTYNAMHAWFAMDSTKSAVVEVKGLHQYDWSEEVNVGVKEMLEIQRLIWMQYYNNLKEDLVYEREHKRHLEGLSPSSLSLLNQLRIYIPELFPDLNKIVFLEDDIVVQHDISPLWELDLNGKVVGAVVSSWCGDDCCPGRKYEDYLNFSHPLISSNFDRDRCAWLYGMNVFDIAAWRRSNITATYHHWLKLSLNYGLELWHPGVLPPSLIAFEGHVHPIDPKWHLAGLGYQPIEVHHQILETAAVIHFSGPAKPWLEIGFPEVRGLWKKYVSESNSFIRKCEVME